MANNNYNWAVVGAGAAGIAAVSKLLDAGIKPREILWIDPFFQVGDLGQYWGKVSSNTKVKFFLNFLQASQEFSYPVGKFIIDKLDPEKTCKLEHIVEPLQAITKSLMQKVATLKERVGSLQMHNNMWNITTEENNYKSRKVILATGAEPKSLDLAKDELSFVDAIDKQKLAVKFNSEYTYAVFGSSHSAFIIVRNLIELGAKRVINFYRSPCKYAIDMGDYYIFDNTGLKGETAEWTRANVDGVLPVNLIRYLSTEENITKHLKDIDQVIYAIGFAARNNIQIGEFESLAHDPHLGTLAPGLYGLGIAYPELKSDLFGNPEHQVGLWKFIQYIEKVLPVWMSDGVKVI